MIVDGREKFLLRSVSQGNNAAIRLLYQLYAYDKKRYSDAAVLYQKILMQYPPAEAIKIIYLGDFDSLSKSEIDREYLYAISKVVEFMVDNEHFFAAAQWAKKGMDLYNIFHSGNGQIENMKLQSKEYNKLKKQFEDNQDFFDNGFYYGNHRYPKFLFAWEPNPHS